MGICFTIVGTVLLSRMWVVKWYGFAYPDSVTRPDWKVLTFGWFQGISRKPTTAIGIYQLLHLGILVVSLLFLTGVMGDEAPESSEQEPEPDVELDQKPGSPENKDDEADAVK